MNGLSRKELRFVRLAVLFLFLCIDIIIIRNCLINIKMKSCTFTESARELQNPGRGFYNLYRFMISDEDTDYEKQVLEFYEKDKDTALTLVEINLQNYRDGKISEAGLQNIRCLFQALERLDKQLIIRFLYDWDGENEKNEPETIDIILKHMEQLEGILKEYSSRIFILQGLFVGNWGEMNGTRYDNEDDLHRLTEQLDRTVESSVYLAVRTPTQWRKLTGLQDISEEALENHPFAGRLSLYNDGMLGNESDYGTYRIQEMKGIKFSKRWEELVFQDQLCRWVPNGGEVIDDNDYNDFDNAIKDLAAMHVTYLNEGHDLNVLEKWKKTVVTEEGCYQGMDGYTYIERHLGYRLLIHDVNFFFNPLARELRINVNMKNVGFAPLYAESKAGLVLYDTDQETYLLYEMQGDLRQLAGGNEAEDLLALTVDLHTDKLQHTNYEVYFFIVDSDTGRRILLANEEDEEEYGYHIGTVKVYDWLKR